MIKYTVKVSFEGDKSQLELKNVVADGIIPELGSRYFLHEDGERTEIPADKAMFVFSKERQEALK
jgi:hypothetical protein